MPEEQSPSPASAAQRFRPLLDLPISKTAVERLVENILARPGADADFLLITADAVQEIIREAPSDSDVRRLRHLVSCLHLRAKTAAGGVVGKAEAAALLAACPISMTSIRMLQASMRFSCAAWGWQPFFAAMIAGAEEMEQPRPVS